MKHNPENEWLQGENQQGSDPLDQQLNRVTRALRDTGIAPERDLWPEIEQAIDQAGPIGSIRTHNLAGWRVVALAASVLLLVGIGLVQHGGLPGNPSDFQALGPESRIENPASSRQVVDQALVDLNEALAADPYNTSLSRLVLMIHKSRGKMIRNTAKRLGIPGG